MQQWLTQMTMNANRVLTTATFSAHSSSAATRKDRSAANENGAMTEPMDWRISMRIRVAASNRLSAPKALNRPQGADAMVAFFNNLNSFNPCPRVPCTYFIIKLLFINCLTDIDECARGSPCPRGHQCTNTIGSYTCTSNLRCEAGYEANSAGTQCQGNESIKFIAANHFINLSCDLINSRRGRMRQIDPRL